MSVTNFGALVLFRCSNQSSQKKRRISARKKMAPRTAAAAVRCTSTGSVSGRAAGSALW